MKHLISFLTVVGLLLTPLAATYGANDSSEASQQTKKNVSGQIKDSAGQALSGAAVMVPNSTVGTVADSDGRFSLSIPAGTQYLEVSCIGYKTVQVPVGTSSVYDVTLEDDAEFIDDVVVIGYGTVKKSDLTGSVAQVKSKELTSFTVSNPIQALQGRAAGVNITSANGAPNGNFIIRVRGTNSIKGNNDPLYIIDGVPAEASSISAHDIASLEILKDASATAIYGSRGSNGVVLITTKRGKSGKATVEYNYELGYQTIRKKLDLMNSQEYMKFYNLQQVNDLGTPYFSDSEIAAAAGKDFDWQDAVYQGATMHNHNVNISGGNDKTKYNISFSALDRDGIVKTSNFKKYNVRSNLDQELAKWISISLNAAYSYTDNHEMATNEVTSYSGSSVHSGALRCPPTLPAFNEDGSYRMMPNAYPFLSTIMINPVNYIDSHSTLSSATYANILGAVTLTPFKGFTFKSSLGVEDINSRYDAYVTSEYINWTNSANVNASRTLSLINENIATYDVKFGEGHNINLMAGYTTQTYVSKGLGGYATGFLSDVLETYNLSGATGANQASSSYSNWQLASWLGRFNYNYKGRYLLTASIRADGSSRYSAGNKWGYFPSAAFAWHASNEDFLKNSNTVSDLKLRASYGEVGSTAISPYQTVNLLSSGKAALGGDGGLVTTFLPGDVYPGDLKWETTRQFDLGVDIAFFNDRLRITADYYDKLTRDLLNNVYLPTSTGYVSSVKNIGKMSNKGFEFSIDGNIISTRDFQWNVSANISRNKNEIVELADHADIYGKDMMVTIVNGTVSLLREGEPMGVFDVFKFKGYDDKGMCTFEDVNNDGNFDNSDRQILGDPNPDFTYGLSSNFKYKGLELSILFQGSQGNDIYNVAEVENYMYGYGLNLERKVYNGHWDAAMSAAEKAAAAYPAITSTMSLLHSDLFIEDGSYLRLKNIQLGYNLPVEKWNQKFISGIYVYVSGQNILTFTKYTGRDPEVNSFGNDTDLGIDWFPYPTCKVFSAGLKLKF